MQEMIINQEALPEIPSKKYFTIGEVSELCTVKPHVLRYWEQEFPQLNNVVRRGTRRYYQQQDILIVRQIRALLYEQGFTITGAIKQLTDLEEGKASFDNNQYQTMIKTMINELEEVRNLLLPIS